MIISDPKPLPIKVPDQGNEVANEGNDDEEFIQVLNDVEELFGEPVFLTH